jgi:hypothetical protein
MTPQDESSEEPVQPASPASGFEASEYAAQPRYVAPPTGWAAIAAWSYWRHNPWGDPPSFPTVPVREAEASGGIKAGSDAPGEVDPCHPRDLGQGVDASRRRRVLAVVVIELFAVFGIIGAVVSYAAHNGTLGALALGAAIVANVVLWAWARVVSRRASVIRRDAPRGRS